jgi:glutamate carboxypeptidase
MLGPSTLEHRVTDWLGVRRKDMISLLADLVGIDSGTANVEGVRKVGIRIEDFFRRSSFTPAMISRFPGGRGLRVEAPGASSRHSMLLMGHLDTVFPTGEAARRPFEVVDRRAKGPGVADMKAGLVMNSFVLAAFRACGGNARPLVGLYTEDEETGSLASRAIIEREAEKAAYAFNAEPGRASGNIVIERRGGVFMRLAIRGKAAHAGIDPRGGISAIEELAHKILAFHGLRDFDPAISVNVGVVSGGQSVNTTAPFADALIDLRFREPGDRERVMAAIGAIASKSFVAGASAVLEITGEFAPLVATSESTALLRFYQGAAADLGFSVDAEFSGGCADSGFAAQKGSATLCALGPVGGGAHSPDEYIELDTIVTRAQALALTILRVGADAASHAATDHRA